MQDSDADKHVPEPSCGPDEEGETPMEEASGETDRAAWMHRKDKPTEGGETGGG